MKESDYFIIVFAVNDKSSFDAVQNFVNDIIFQKFKGEIVLCGNKIDIIDRKVDKFESLKFCHDHNLVYYEVSAKNDDDIERLFYYVDPGPQSGIISINILQNYLKYFDKITTNI